MPLEHVAAFGTPRIASWAEHASPSPMQGMLALASRPDVISLALGFPDPGLIPSQEISECACRTIAGDPKALQYQDPSMIRLREIVCSLMLRRGVVCDPENVFITAGAQQALHLISRLLMNEHSTAIEEELSYPGFQKTIEPFQPHVIRIHSTSTEGIDSDMLDATLARHDDAALVYLMADGHNPLGVSLSQQKRLRIDEIAHRRGVPIIEDDPYGLLQYERDPPPPIHTVADGSIWYVGSFSKILAPALRLGWVVAPSSMIPLLAMLKEAADLNTVNLSQRIACTYFASCRFEDHLARLQGQYRLKRDAMHAALKRQLPRGCKWQVPRAGVFFWVDLPEHVDADQVLKWSIEKLRVAFLPASAFSRGMRRNGIRLCFSRCSLPDIEEGVARVGMGLTRFV